MILADGTCFTSGKEVWTDVIYFPQINSLSTFLQEFYLPTFNLSTNNVEWGPTALNVKVQNKLALAIQGTRGAEVQSYRKDIMYGSFQLEAKWPVVSGSCSGFFLSSPNYNVDYPELDVEFLSARPTQIHYVVHPRAYLPDGSATPETYQVYDTTRALFGDMIKIRMDWFPGYVNHYFNDTLKMSMKTRVDAPSLITLNIWSNGDGNWTSGPPMFPSEFQIYSMLFLFNTTTPKNCEKIVTVSSLPSYFSTSNPPPSTSPIPESIGFSIIRFSFKILVILFFI